MKILHPGIVQGKAQHKGSQIIIAQHENIVGRMLLQLFLRLHNLYRISGRLCHLTETQRNVIAELMRFFVFYILGEDTQLFCIRFLPAKLCVAHFHRCLQYIFL